MINYNKKIDNVEGESMERLTNLSESKGKYVTSGIDGKIDSEGYYGAAIEKLAKFENLYESIIEKQSSLANELEVLRAAGKEKNFKFKELLGQKIMNEMLLMQIRGQGI
jgi:hypothetical protein